MVACIAYIYCHLARRFPCLLSVPEELCHAHFAPFNVSSASILHLPDVSVLPFVHKWLSFQLRVKDLTKTHLISEKKGVDIHYF